MLLVIDRWPSHSWIALVSWPLLGRFGVQDAGRIRHKSMTDRLAVVEFIGATTTKTGLKVDCALDTRTYQKGIKVSNAR